MDWPVEHCATKSSAFIFWKNGGGVSQSSDHEIETQNTRIQEIRIQYPRPGLVNKLESAGAASAYIIPASHIPAEDPCSL
jgi:hypothetical protein